MYFGYTLLLIITYAFVSVERDPFYTARRTIETGGGSRARRDVNVCLRQMWKKTFSTLNGSVSKSSFSTTDSKKPEHLKIRVHVSLLCSTIAITILITCLSNYEKKKNVRKI